MYHYVYTLMFDDGMKYIGMRSTHLEPELDVSYRGSGRYLPDERDQTVCEKTIVKVFKTREEAADYEQQLILEYDAVNSDEFYNKRLRTHDRHGCTLTPEHIEKATAHMKGRKRPEYAKKYVGDGRTPAQKDGHKRAAEKLRGTKCPSKGRTGTKNNGFSPWYYITPDGVRVEVHDETKAEYAYKLGFTVRQLINRFHYTNEHKEGRYHPFKGWTFGNL